MTKANINAKTSPNASSTTASPENSIVKNDKKKKSMIPKIFGSKRSGNGSDEEAPKEDEDRASPTDLDEKVESRTNAFLEGSPAMRRGLSARETSPEIQGLNLSNFEQPMSPTETESFRMFVATWNVGGKAPNHGLDLEDFLLVEGSADIYVLGFQEIVPLSAGNVFVMEDNEPAAKWLALISHALNSPKHDFNVSCDSEPVCRTSNHKDSKDSRSPNTLNFFQKPNLKVLSRNLRAESSLLKSCNCPVESPSKERRRIRIIGDPIQKFDSQVHGGSSVDELLSIAEIPLSPRQMEYCLIASKQMVGIFLTIWIRKELVPHIGHLRVDSLGRGIMGCLGNKGCISISMSLHQTSFCFVCSHLASGEKEGDEMKRNADVIEILKGIQFPRICKNPYSRVPENIVNHDRIIWLGDLNYRVALSYDKTKALLEDNDWDTLLGRDQLNIERDAGRVFSGFHEGRILFAPTYKYSHNSDSYAGETTKSKRKRRTPAWCDRILWRGNGIEQLSYIRGESRFSDHRPVCAVFSVDVEVRSRNNRFRKGYSYACPRSKYEECIPQRHSFYDY